MKLKDRVAIVTGAASGIGAASARLFAAEGAKLALVDQNEVGLKKVASEIKGKGGSAITITADVSNNAKARTGVERVIKRWGSRRCAADGSRRLDRRHGRCHRRSRVGPHLRHQRQGHLSLDSLRHPPHDRRQDGRHRDHRLAARPVESRQECRLRGVEGAIASFTKTIAVDHALQGIRVNALMPGVIDTPMPARSLKRYAIPRP
jgi:NAD(P)-dependent dehydrogenase (short-subunit alcohol dehydrogenase family)